MSEMKPGDWICTTCSNHNFARRNVCKQCDAKREGSTTIKKEMIKTTPQQEKSKVPELYLAVDIERIGAGFEYGVLAIGVCFGKSDGTIIEQRAFCDKVPAREMFEERTWNEFWCKFPEILAKINENAIPNHIVAFRDYLVELEKKYGPFGRKHKDKVVFKLLSDNPAYDIGLINLEFYKNKIKFPMAEMFDDYVSTNDPSQQIRMMTSGQKKKVEKYITVSHDHWPVNDATGIFQTQCGIKAVLASKE